MSGYSEDLRERIVSSVEGGGMSKAQAARTFSVSLSSVKRYVGKAKRGESLAPKKRPGSTPKLDEKARKIYFWEWGGSSPLWAPILRPPTKRGCFFSLVPKNGEKKQTLFSQIS